LLLALLLIAALTATGIGLSVLIVGELRSSSNIDNSIVAYYAAETGIEQALLKVRDGRQHTTLAGTISGEAPNSLTSLSGNLTSVVAGWKTDGSTASENTILTSLPKNKSAEIDLFNPDDGTALGIRSVQFTWSDRCPLIESWLEVSYVYWKLSSSTWSSDDQAVYKNIYPCGTTGRYSCNPALADYFDPSTIYKLRVKALYCDVDNLVISAYPNINATGNKIDISSRVNIKSVGSYANSQIALTASTPWSASIMGIFDYAIFSETDLTKKR